MLQRHARPAADEPPILEEEEPCDPLTITSLRPLILHRLAHERRDDDLGLWHLLDQAS
jgi:hypothetical protein